MPMLHTVMLIISSTQYLYPQLHLLFLLLVLIISQFCIQPCHCLNFVISYSDFYHMTNISLVQTNSFSATETSSDFINYSVDMSVKLLPFPIHPAWRTDPTDNQSTSTWSGWMSYNQSIPFLDSSGKAQSFNTSFEFELNTPGDYGDCPSGMAFFILPKERPPLNVSSKYFGLADDATVSPATNSFFAVEFDTYKSPNTADRSSSHIGIDISSINSINFTDTSNNKSDSYYPELYLYNNYTFRAWISYDSSLKLIKVWMTNRSYDYSANLNPPNNTDLMPILQSKYDLSSVFAQNNMYIGFSATTQTNTAMLGVAINSWYFSISQNDITTSAPATIDPSLTPTPAPAPAILQLNSQHSGMRLEIIIVIAAIGIIATAAAVTLALCRHRRLKAENEHLLGTIDQNTYMNDSYLSVISLPRYSYQEMQTSTNNFDSNSSLIGEGGFSRVYKGKLADGSMVAIKRLKDGVRKKAEFSAELKMINTVRHRNLLKLQGWCYEKGEIILVYKFMNNGSLDRFIFGEKRGSLDGNSRLRILSGVAEALQYLHFGLGDCVLHRDVKAANVLLTDDFEAVLGDFGLARLIKHNESVTATMVGTVGYVAPEVILEGKVTDKADVYSFGVLALEVACGRKVIVKNPEPEFQNCIYLVEHVSQLQRRNSLIEALDPTILALEPVQTIIHISKIHEQWMRTLELAVLCCQRKPESRPDMRYVNEEIHSIMEQYKAAMDFQSPVVINESDLGYPLLIGDRINASQSSTHSSWTAPSTSTLELPR